MKYKGATISLMLGMKEKRAREATFSWQGVYTICKVQKPVTLPNRVTTFRSCCHPGFSGHLSLQTCGIPEVLGSW